MSLAPSCYTTQAQPFDSFFDFFLLPATALECVDAGFVKSMKFDFVLSPVLISYDLIIGRYNQ